MAKVVKDQEIISIKPIKRVTTEITLIGDSPLIVHAWSEKAKKEMLAAQMKIAKAKKAKEPKNPVRDFFDSAYWICGKPEFDESWDERQALDAINNALQNHGGKVGFPVTGIKQCAFMSVYRAGMVANTTGMKAAFKLLGTENSEFATIEGVHSIAPTVDMREDMVKIGGIAKTADIRYRVQYSDWKMRLIIEHANTGTFSLGDIINAINYGGFASGIGEWRSERNGTFGAYHVAIGGED